MKEEDIYIIHPENEEQANALKAFVKAKKMTQTDLAKAVGLSYIQMGRHETQKSTPSSDVLQKLAVVLDTSTDFLMLGSRDDIISSQL